MSEMILSVPNITCGHCKASIEDAVNQVSGVNSVNVTVDTKTVHVAYDPTTTTSAAITQTIEDQGFEVAKSPEPR